MIGQLITTNWRVCALARTSLAVLISHVIAHARDPPIRTRPVINREILAGFSWPEFSVACHPPPHQPPSSTCRPLLRPNELYVQCWNILVIYAPICCPIILSCLLKGMGMISLQLYVRRYVFVFEVPTLYLKECYVKFEYDKVVTLKSILNLLYFLILKILDINN